MVKGDGDPGAGLPKGLPKEALQELDTFADDCLVKAGLTELSEKLRALRAGK